MTTSERLPLVSEDPRLHKPVTITEKIDGTNGLIEITRVPFGTGSADLPDGVYTVGDFTSPLGTDGLPEWEFQVRAGSRNRWLAPGPTTSGSPGGCLRTP
ncbi:hypothetical protein GCM10029963_28780 [Micromonospora andamanensis]